MRWVSVRGFEGFYEVSDSGEVRRHCGAVLKQHSANGYRHVTLCRHGKSKSFSVHRLVLEGFISEIPKGMHSNHINSKRDDNRLENLEIVTPWQNSQHSRSRSYKNLPTTFFQTKFEDIKRDQNRRKYITTAGACKICKLTKSSFIRWANLLRVRAVTRLNDTFIFYRPDMERLGALINKGSITPT